MKILALLFLTIGACVARETYEKTCEGKADPGMCLAYVPSYYYNAETGTCEFFVYGGCQGNGNRYSTKEECEENCAERSSDVEACTAKPETGVCKAYMPSYYYDPETRQCKFFVYGGCGGNANRYRTEQECYDSCAGGQRSDVDTCSLKPETGPCLAYFPSFYYDAETGKCEKFIYGGCRGNDNRFRSEEECYAACGQRAPEEDLCTLEPDGGMCRAYIPAYYYDSKTNECKEFIYGGCGGNDNIFSNKEDCYRRCSAVWEADEDTCSLEAETGNCRGFYPRFFFNSKTGACEMFIYGGCGGNSNNFKSVDECTESCGERSSDVEACTAKPETGVCKAYMPSYYYDPETRQCKFFVYGGCGGNANRYRTEQECYDSCAAS